MATSALLSHSVSSPMAHRYLRSNSMSDKFDRVLLQQRTQASAPTSLRLVNRVESAGVETEPGPELPPPPSGSSRPPGTRYPGLSLWDRAWQRGAGELDLRLWAGVNASREVTGLPYRFEVQHGRSQASTWNMAIVDDTGQYHPLRVGGDYQGVFGWTKDHRMRARAVWGGREFDYSGWAGGFGHQRSNRDGGWFRDMVWSGVDESKPLFAPRKTMPSIRSTSKKIVRKVQTAVEILSAAGAFKLAGLKDGPIRLFHRQSGRYGDWLARLVEMAGQEWHLIGKRFEAYDAWQGSGSSFTYSVKTPVRSESFDSAIADVITRVTVRRLQEAEQQAEEEPEVATTFGTYTKSFGQAMNGVEPNPIEETLGIFSDYKYRNKDGEVVAVRGARGGSVQYPTFLLLAPIVNVHSVEYTFGARSGVVAAEGYGRILFRGTPANKPDQEDIPEEFEAAFDLTVPDDELEEIFGEILEELEINELIATQAQGLEFGKGWLARRKAAMFPLSITAPLNPAIIDGTRITIVDEVLGLTHTRPAIAATHSFGDSPSNQWTRFVIGGHLGKLAV